MPWSANQRAKESPVSAAVKLDTWPGTADLLPRAVQEEVRPMDRQLVQREPELLK